MQKIEAGNYRPKYNYLNIFSDFLYRRSGFTLAAVFSVATVLYFFLVIAPLAGKIVAGSPGTIVLDARFGYSHTEAIHFLRLIGNPGLKTYLAMSGLWDNIYPLLYATSISLILSLIYRNITKPGTLIRRVNILPLAVMVIDWCENTLEVRLIEQYYESQTVNDTLAQVASSVTIIKWVLLSLIILVFITGLIILIVRRIRRAR